MPRSSGLHVDVLDAARAKGVPLVPGGSVPWLSVRGHTEPSVLARAPRNAIDALASIHSTFGGDSNVLATKSRGSGPRPDLVHQPSGILIEVDEVQHFSTSRLRSLDLYPAEVALGFDVDEYRRLCRRWQSSADKAFAHKTSADFPKWGGRTAQRAYNDSLRDLLSQSFTGYPVVRVAAPDRDVRGALDTIVDQLARLTTGVT